MLVAPSNKYLFALLLDLLYKDYNFDQKFSVSTSNSSGLVRPSHLYMLFSSLNKIEFIFLITSVPDIGCYGNRCEDQ
jgi:hypothetical protein